MKKTMSNSPIAVKHDWENNPKVRPTKIEFGHGYKAPKKREEHLVQPDVTKDVKSGDGKTVSNVSIVRHDTVVGKAPVSPKKLEKYSTDGKAKEVKPPKSMKEGFVFGFNELYRSIMNEAADPNAAPPADPNAAPPADPNAAPPADPNAAPPTDPNAAPTDDSALGGEAGGGLVGQIEEAYNTLESTIATVQDAAAQEALNGVKDTLAAAYEMLTGTPLAGAEGGEGGEGTEGAAGAEDGGVGEVPNLEQGAAPTDPNAQPPAA